MCLAGYGKVTPTDATCAICDWGSFQPGGQTTCQQCPTTAFYAPVDGVGGTWVSNGTSVFKGAFGSEACVPVHSQLSPEAGQAYFSEESPLRSLLTVTQQQTLTTCLSSCPAGGCCLAQFEGSSGTCRKAVLTPAAASATSGKQLMYKLPPSTLTAASSVDAAQKQQKKKSQVVSAKMMSSGFYAICDIPAAAAATWQVGAGFNLGPDARTFAKSAAWDTTSTSRAACQQICDASNVCWGFIYDVATKACLYRGGVDALSTRSFFVLPSPTSVNLESLGWAGGKGGANSNPSPCNLTVSGGNITVNAGSSNSSSNATSGSSGGQQPQQGGLPVSSPTPSSPSPAPQPSPSPSPAPQGE